MAHEAPEEARHHLPPQARFRLSRVRLLSPTGAGGKVAAFGFGFVGDTTIRTPLGNSVASRPRSWSTKWCSGPHVCAVTAHVAGAVRVGGFCGGGGTSGDFTFSLANARGEVRDG